MRSTGGDIGQSKSIVVERILSRTSKNEDPTRERPPEFPQGATISVDSDDVIEKVRGGLATEETLANTLTEIITYYPIQVYETIVEDPVLTEIVDLFQRDPSESLIRAFARFLSVSQTLIRIVFSREPRIIDTLQQCLTPAVTPPQVLAALDFIETLAVKGGTFGITLIVVSRFYDYMFQLAKNVPELHLRILEIISKCVILDPVYGMHTFAEEGSTDRKTIQETLKVMNFHPKLRLHASNFVKFGHKQKLTKSMWMTLSGMMMLPPDMVITPEIATRIITTMKVLASLAKMNADFAISVLNMAEFQRIARLSMRKPDVDPQLAAHVLSVFSNAIYSTQSHHTLIKRTLEIHTVVKWLLDGEESLQNAAITFLLNISVHKSGLKLLLSKNNLSLLKKCAEMSPEWEFEIRADFILLITTLLFECKQELIATIARYCFLPLVVDQLEADLEADISSHLMRVLYCVLSHYINHPEFGMGFVDEFFATDDNYERLEQFCADSEDPAIHECWDKIIELQHPDE